MTATQLPLDQPAAGVFLVLAAAQAVVMVGIAVYLNFGGRYV